MSQPPPEPSQILVEFENAFHMTQTLSNLPYNYRPTEKPLFALDILYTSLLQISYLYIHFCCYALIGTKDDLQDACEKADFKKILV